MSNPWNTEVTIELQKTEFSTLLRSICCECTVIFNCLCFFASKSWQAWKPNFLSICQSRYWNSVSPDMRACNLPCLHEVTLIDLRLADELNKDGFCIMSRGFMISKTQKIFPDTDLLFFPLSLSFASLPQSRLKWNLFISGLCLSQKCSFTERSTDFSWNSDYFETW